MALIDDVQAINSELANLDPEYNKHDRGQFYLEHYVLTGSEAALLQGHISMFSGSAGGLAFAANYLLADRGEQSNEPFSYSDNANGVNQIYDLSEKVAEEFGVAAAQDVNGGDGGDLDIQEGINAALASWLDYADDNGLEDLANWFPGKAAVDTLFGVVPNPSIDAYTLVEAANFGSFLFGKSVADFSGLSGSLNL